VAAKNPALDLIILDIFMPALQGPDLLELIRQRMPGSLPRVLFCSSMDETPLWELAARHQVDGCISKSANREAFLKAIDNVLAQRAHRAH
jgi:DNA-binding NarL/FixJ family response regulator